MSICWAWKFVFGWLISGRVQVGDTPSHSHDPTGDARPRTLQMLPRKTRWAWRKQTQTHSLISLLLPAPSSQSWRCADIQGGGGGTKLPSVLLPKPMHGGDPRFPWRPLFVGVRGMTGTRSCTLHLNDTLNYASLCTAARWICYVKKKQKKTLCPLLRFNSSWENTPPPSSPVAGQRLWKWVEGLDWDTNSMWMINSCTFSFFFVGKN